VGAPGELALRALREAVLRAEPAALAAVGVSLSRAGDSTDITGDHAEDERVAAVDLPVRDADTAAMVVRTTCGNVRLIGLRRGDGGWRAARGVALVPEVRPGGCVRTTVLAQAVALRGDPARDVAVAVRWEDSIGDEVRGPHLWVGALDAREGLTVLLERAPFGGTDDRTGASSEGSLAVIDDLPPPRPLFVEVRPGRRGVGGPGLDVRTVRRYELRGGRLELVDEQRAQIAMPPDPPR
jgi:hypothetical protein